MFFNILLLTQHKCFGYTALVLFPLDVNVKRLFGELIQEILNIVLAVKNHGEFRLKPVNVEDCDCALYSQKR